MSLLALRWRRKQAGKAQALRQRLRLGRRVLGAQTQIIGQRKSAEAKAGVGAKREGWACYGLLGTYCGCWQDAAGHGHLGRDVEKQGNNGFW
ncbi:unnamed protein product, partial [Ilex paraguariensis]